MMQLVLVLEEKERGTALRTQSMMRKITWHTTNIAKRRTS